MTSIIIDWLLSLKNNSWMRKLFLFILANCAIKNASEQFSVVSVNITSLLIASEVSFQPVLHDWCTKGSGMCYPVCVMVHIKEPLLLIEQSSL